MDRNAFTIEPNWNEDRPPRGQPTKTDRHPTIAEPHCTLAEAALALYESELAEAKDKGTEPPARPLSYQAVQQIEKRALKKVKAVLERYRDWRT